MHERAARTHDEAAELYDTLGMPDKAEAEREKASRERADAVTDRDAASREADEI